MGIRISTESENARPYRAFAGPSSGNGFDFDPDAWVEMAYPSTETRFLKVDGERKPYRATFSEEGMAKMVAKFRAARASDPNYAPLVNVDHKALDPDKTTEAAAWLIDLKTENGRLYGRFRWSSLGEELARGGVYRFVSVEVDSDETPRSQWPEKGVTWDRLDGVAITNDHALKGLAPFAHRAEEIEKEETKPKGHKMEAIKKMLGLAADATEEQVADAIKALQTQVETYTAEKEEAETAEKAEAFRAKYGDRFKDDESAVAFYRANPEKAEELAATVKVVEKIVEKVVERPATVAHRKGGTPAEAQEKTPLGIYRKYESMPEGKEKDDFLAAHAREINAGANEANSE
jgi:phage I-like protein